MNPILKYPGAKWRLSPWIISHMPPHESYGEPYFGSGAVFFNKPKCRIETVNDMDGEVVNFFRMCRQFPDELARSLHLTPWAREERDAAFDPAGEIDAIERARRFAVRFWQTFGAGTSKSQGWRYTTGKKQGGGPNNTYLWSRLPECVIAAAERLKDAQIENRPALDVINRLNGPNVLLYVDPPYVRKTRNSNNDAYNHEMTDADHEALLNALNKHSGMLLLSGYDCEMYRDMLSDWELVTRKTTAERGAKRTECLWINPAAQQPKLKEGLAEGLSEAGRYAT